MRKIGYLMLVTCCLWLCGGCGQKTENKAHSSEFKVQVKNDAFPQIMAGVWQAKDSQGGKWGIKFEPDGSIKKIIHSMAGPIRLEEGGVYSQSKFNSQDYMMLQMGPCTADYQPDTKMLSVSLIVDYYRMELPTGVLEGKMRDDFAGKISENGKSWNVKWWEYGWLEGATPPDVNYIKAHPEDLVFYKLDISDPNTAK